MVKGIYHRFFERVVGDIPECKAQWGGYSIHWGFHARNIDAIDPSSLELLLQKFCSDNIVFQYWRTHVTEKCEKSLISEPDKIGRQEIFAMFYGLVRYLELRNNTGLLAINRENAIPLLEYGVKGFGCNFDDEYREESWFDKSVKLLLKVGLDPTEDSRMQAALFALAWYGLEMVSGFRDSFFHRKFGLSSWSGLQTLINSGMDPNRPLARLKVGLKYGYDQE